MTLKLTAKPTTKFAAIDGSEHPTAAEAKARSRTVIQRQRLIGSEKFTEEQVDLIVDNAAAILEALDVRETRGPRKAKAAEQPAE